MECDKYLSGIGDDKLGCSKGVAGKMVGDKWRLDWKVG